MKKVYQTKYGKEKGNCFQACVASIFEMALEDVPDFCNHKPVSKWYERYLKWLQEKGFSCITIQSFDLNEIYFKDCLLIVNGKNDVDAMHSIVYKNGVPIHNPNRHCKGIIPETVDIIFPLEPKLGG